MGPGLSSRFHWLSILSLLGTAAFGGSAFGGSAFGGSAFGGNALEGGVVRRRRMDPRRGPRAAAAASAGSPSADGTRLGNPRPSRRPVDSGGGGPSTPGNPGPSTPGGGPGLGSPGGAGPTTPGAGPIAPPTAPEWAPRLPAACRPARTGKLALLVGFQQRPILAFARGGLAAGRSRNAVAGRRRPLRQGGAGRFPAEPRAAQQRGAAGAVRDPQKETNPDIVTATMISVRKVGEESTRAVEEIQRSCATPTPPCARTRPSRSESWDRARRWCR